MSKTVDLSTVNRSQAARATGASVSEISRIFTRDPCTGLPRRTPSLRLAYLLAQHLGISLDLLYHTLYPNGYHTHTTERSDRG